MSAKQKEVDDNKTTLAELEAKVAEISQFNQDWEEAYNELVLEKQNLEDELEMLKPGMDKKFNDLLESKQSEISQLRQNHDEWISRLKLQLNGLKNKDVA